MSCNQIAGHSLHLSHQIWFFERFFFLIKVCVVVGRCDIRQALFIHLDCHFDVAGVIGLTILVVGGSIFPPNNICKPVCISHFCHFWLG